MSYSRLLELASAIQSQVSDIQQHLKKTGQSDPSFDCEAKIVDFEGIEDTRSLALDNLAELTDLLSTPREVLQSKAATDLLSRDALDRFNVYEAIPVGSSKTYEEIASTTKLPARTIRRLLRHAMTQRIFCEPKPGVVAHTQISRLLTEDVKIRDYYGIICQEVWPAAARTCDAIHKWPASTESGQSGYQFVNGRNLSETLEQDKAKRKRHDSAMGAHGNERTYNVSHVLDNYDWASLGSATVVDVGGGFGNVSIPLARRFPSLNVVVEDLPSVVTNVSVEGEDPDVKSRIRFLEHDYFNPQPVKDADVYFIRRVIMERTDEQAVLILRALIPALKPGAIILIQDPQTPSPGTCPLWQERRLRNSDMLALVLENGGTRDEEGFRSLFEKAGPGFNFKGVKTVPGSDVAFAEAVWQG